MNMRATLEQSVLQGGEIPRFVHILSKLLPNSPGEPSAEQNLRLKVGNRALVITKVLEAPGQPLVLWLPHCCKPSCTSASVLKSH